MPRFRTSTFVAVIASVMTAGFASVDMRAYSQNPASKDSATTGERTVAQSSPPAVDPMAIREQVFEALREGEDDRAFKLARIAFKAAPDEPQIVFLMGYVLAGRHRFPEAIRLLDGFAEETPAVELPALGQTAEWMVKFGWFDEAESRYLKILQNVPGAVEAHRQIAELYMRQGRRVEASKHLISLCGLGNVKEAELRILLRLLSPFAGDGAHEGFDPVGPLGKARYEISQGNWEAALAELVTDETDNAINEDVSGLKARCFVQLDDQSALETWAEDAAMKDPASPDHWYALGCYHAAGDKHVEAVRCFCRCVELDQTDFEAYQRLAQSFEKIGQNGPAAESAARAKLIQETQELGSAMAGSRTRDVTRIERLIELLTNLRRPIEALSWRGVKLAYDQSDRNFTAEQVQAKLDELVRDRKSILESASNDADTLYRTCGVDPDSLNDSAQADPDAGKDASPASQAEPSIRQDTQ